VYDGCLLMEYQKEAYNYTILDLIIIFILKSMVFPAIWMVHRIAISARIALLTVRFVLKSYLLSTNHIRVLTSANQSYLITGFKQPMDFKKNVIWQISKKKNLHVMIYTLDSWVPKQFFGYSSSKLSKNCNKQIVTGKNANKSKFKAAGQTGLRKNKCKFAYRISCFKRTKLHQNSFNHS
jgi:hypothetical protein